MRIFIVLLFMLFSIRSFATSNADYFHKRFQVIRKGNVVSEIRDRQLSPQFRITPYLKFIKEQIKFEQQRMKSDPYYFENVRSSLQADMLEKGYDDAKQIDYVVDSLKKLENLNIDEIFNNAHFKTVIGQFSVKMSDALSKIGLNVIAKLDDSRFFYKRNVTHQVVRWGLNFARKRLSTVPLLNTAFYVIVEVERLIRERRTYHQNMALHYLEKFPADTFGLSHLEVNHVVSSIYESRISWFAFWESDMATANWDKYGMNIFYRSIRMANNNFRNHRELYTSVGERVNYAFQYASRDGEEVIVNMFDSEHSWTTRPAIAHFSASPLKVTQNRMILQLAQLGLSFVSLPAFIKDTASSFMKSFHESQRLTEGALHAYFESNGMTEMRDLVLLQNLNPFEPRLEKVLHSFR